ncbi:hypothetical protein QP158_08350, partial [Streptococcus agalactiae]|nr:hypothetical protein [Streptococcus agalactiae]
LKRNLFKIDVRAQKDEEKVFMRTAWHISQLIMMGLQTEYCFDTSVKVAFEYGYDIFIPQGGHLTFDTPTLSGDSIKKHYENIWHHRFATMVAKDNLLKLINEE